MSYLTQPQVQQWLEETKYTVSGINPEREQTARDLVFGLVASRYDTATWLDGASTPSMITNIMSGFYAAWLYNSVVSEDMGDSNYATNLLLMLERLLSSISSGALDLDGVIPSTLGTAAFFPTDAQDWDCEGNEIKFTMGVTF